MSVTTNKNLTKPAHNDDVDTWDVPVNGNSDIIDACLGAVTVINMTSLSTKTLSTTDLQATTIKFTGTLNSGAIPVLMPTGVGGAFTMIDATTATDATSKLSFGWTSGGNTVLLQQGATQMMTADGVNLVWALAAAQSISGVTYYDLTGLTGTVVIPEDLCRNQTWIFYGTLVNNALTLQFPQSSGGAYAQVHSWSAAGGSSNLVLSVAGAGSIGTISIAANTKFMAAYYRNSPGSNNWTWARISAAI